MRLTPPARRAFDGAGLSRRELLKSSGVLLVGWSAATVTGTFGVVPILGAQPARLSSGRVDAWLAIDGDGGVTAYTGKCELGQGMFTAQTQLVAEELSVAPERVRLIQCDTSITPDQGTTSGSQSTPANFNDRNLAQAAATARERLVELAAARLGLPAAELTVAGGAVLVRRDPARRVAYGDLLRGQAFDIPLDAGAARKPAKEWSVLGTSLPRLDMAEMATGRLEYVQNIRVPGMLHGAPVRPPEPGARLASVDERSVQDVPGLIRVVVKNDFVGVVAEKPWQAAQAAGRLRVSWTPGAGLPPQATFYERLRGLAARDTLVVDSGDVDRRLKDARTVLRSTYRHPYQMHGSVGTSCAVADVRDGGATVWSATQAVHPLRSTAASMLGLPVEGVRVIFVRGSGCYGINGADTVSYDAAILSQAVGRPVRVQLSRRDEMAWENYGAPFVVEQRVGLDDRGTIAVWDCETWSATLGGRPGYDRPGNVVTGLLAGFQPVPFAARTAPAPSVFGNGSNAAPSYVAGCAGGACGGTGVVRSERALSHAVPSPFFTGPLRSPNRLQNTFAHECFLDEIAAHVGADPVEYRLRHLRDPRLIEVVKAAAARAGWEPRASPRSVRPATGAARGRGMACVLYEGDNGYCALVAEVELDQDTGRLVVRRFVTAQDCGPISNPEGMRSQIEGGALQGLSRALGEEVTWDAGRVTSVDWRGYHSLTLGAEMPIVESVLIDRPDAEAMGAGETTITLVAASVGNAVFDATGARLREVPFTPERVRAALAARGPA